MKKFLLVFACSVLAASPALAQINLAWRNCIAITTGTTAAQANVNYACDGSFAQFRGVVSFISPPNITHFLCPQFTLEISTSNAVLPDYWRMGVGECRDGSFVFPVAMTGIGTGATGSCQNPYIGQNTAGGYMYTSANPTAGKATVVGFFARDTPRALTSGQQYLASMFSIDTFKAIDDGSGVCVGCQIPACLALVKVEIIQESPHPTVTLTAADTRKYITWQGGTPNCAAATPTRNHTWGAIKSIYR